MKTHAFDTIAAIATPLGKGGISVIRISGTNALSVAEKVFHGRMQLSTADSHTAHLGKVVGPEGGLIDEVVATVFRGPNSYSGEDSVEISCHGGILVTKRILELILQNGARHADPGEFTKRAFLNGKLDLSQAEAVADIIHARSDVAHRASVHQLEGLLSNRIHQLRSKLIDSIGLLELELDFVEEGIEFVDKREFQQNVSGAIEEIERLLKTFSTGRIYKEGVRVVIAGPPNAGKSSLLNAMLESNRAIVTDIPGTTRDTIEESVSIGGVEFRLIDTAGLRDAEDVVEREGLRRTEEEARNSDIILLVLDAGSPLDIASARSIDKFYIDEGKALKKWVLALNKCDLPTIPAAKLLKTLNLPQNIDCVAVSAKTGSGLEGLESTLTNIVFRNKEPMNETGATITSARHYDALRRAKDHLSLSAESLKQRQSGEFVAVDMRSALDELGEITGEVTTEEILNGIFSKFCIGK
jgi:tRNA modification GTPase